MTVEKVLNIINSDTWKRRCKSFIFSDEPQTSTAISSSSSSISISNQFQNSLSPQIANLKDDRIIAIALRESKNIFLSISKNEFDNSYKLKKKLYSIINSMIFEYIEIILIILNIIILSFNHKYLDTLNIIFLLIYLIELLFKIISIGFILYLLKSSIFNLFDSILIIISFILWLIPITREYKLYSIISFRFLKIIFLIRNNLHFKWFETFNRINIHSSLNIFYLFILYILFIFICSYISLSLFSSNCCHIQK